MVLNYSVPYPWSKWLHLLVVFTEIIVCLNTNTCTACVFFIGGGGEWVWGHKACKWSRCFNPRLFGPCMLIISKRPSKEKAHVMDWWQNYYVATSMISEAVSLISELPASDKHIPCSSAGHLRIRSLTYGTWCVGALQSKFGHSTMHHN